MDSALAQVTRATGKLLPRMGRDLLIWVGISRELVRTILSDLVLARMIWLYTAILPVALQASSTKESSTYTQRRLCKFPPAGHFRGKLAPT